MVEVCPDCDIAGCVHIRERAGAFAPINPKEVPDMTPKEEQKHTGLLPIAIAICESRTWPGAWKTANEVEQRHYMEDAAAVAAVIATRKADYHEELVALLVDIADHGLWFDDMRNGEKEAKILADRIAAVLARLTAQEGER